MITCLETGGAEMFLYRLVSGFVKKGIPCRVAAMAPSGPVDKLIRDLGVQVDFLGMRPGVPNPVAIVKLCSLLREFKPDVLQTWMYHADLLGLCGGLVGVRRLVWNIRCTDMDLSHYRPMTALTVKACAKLSSRPTAVLTNSHAAKAFHTGLGYRPKRFDVIPNGFDTDEFVPDPQARKELRAEWGVGDDEILVGLAARYDAMKGHSVMARAAAEAMKRAPHLRFALYGEGVTEDNDALMRDFTEAGVRDRCLFLGRRDDVQRVHAAMDAACSSSLFGEGFSNTLAESMACGVPAVGTDVGDTALIVADTGRIVPPDDPMALAAALADLAEMDPQRRRDLGHAARERIVSHYSLPVIVDAYERFYQNLLGQPETP